MKNSMDGDRIEAHMSRRAMLSRSFGVREIRPRILMEADDTEPTLSGVGGRNGEGKVENG